MKMSQSRSLECKGKGGLMNRTMKPPKIIVPRVTTFGLTSTPGFPSNLNFQFPHSQKVKLCSLSPHPVISPDISIILENVNFINLVVYRVVSEAGQALKEGEDTCSQSLKTVLSIVSDPVKRKTMHVESMQCLNAFIKKYLLFHVPNVKRANPYDERATKYELTCFKLISIIYNIFYQLLLDLNIYKCFVDDALIKCMFEKMVNSPVLEERRLIERAFEVLLQNYNGKKKLIKQLLLAKTSLIIDGDYFFGTENILNLIEFFFRNEKFQKNIGQYDDLVKLFQNSIYPIVLSNSLSEFEASFNKLTALFTKNSPNLSFWCLKYLANHFPVTNQQKQKIFLKQIDVLLPNMAPRTLTTAAKEMLKIFGGAIESLSTANIAEVSMMLMDEGFVGLFMCVPDETRKYLIKPLITAAEHGKEMSKQMSLQVLEKFKDINDSQNNSFDKNQKVRSKIWRELKRKANNV